MYLNFPSVNKINFSGLKEKVIQKCKWMHIIHFVKNTQNVSHLKLK